MPPIYIYLLLIVIGIPWWWQSQDTTLLFGMPAWVISAIGVSIIASIYTAFLLSRPWPASEDELPGQEPADGNK